MKWKIKKYQLRITIKANNILHKLRCIGMKYKTSIRYTFYIDAKFV